MSTNATDRLDITELFARLARVLDDKRPDDIHTVYTEDVVVHSPRGGELRGIDAVTAYVRQSLVGADQTQHLNSDVLITVAGDQALASGNQLVAFYRAGEPPHQTSGLRTTCTAVRTSEGWRFREARITLAWTHKS